MLRRESICSPEGYRLDSIWHCRLENESSTEFIHTSKKNPSEFGVQFWVIPVDLRQLMQGWTKMGKFRLEIISALGWWDPRRGESPTQTTRCYCKDECIILNQFYSWDKFFLPEWNTMSQAKKGKWVDRNPFSGYLGPHSLWGKFLWINIYILT